MPTFSTGDWYTSAGRVAYNEEFSEIERYGKDWIYDSTNKTFYVITGSPYTGVQDRLWSWKHEIDEWELIRAFDSDLEMWMLASDDYEDFYIMGTEARDDISYIPSGTYDSSEEDSKVSIWKFDKSADTVTEIRSAKSIFCSDIGTLLCNRIPTR